MVEKVNTPDDAWRHLEKNIHEEPVFANAFRLMNDDSLLMEAGSYASAVALASLGVEEIGKYLLARWQAYDAAFAYDRRQLHLAKQCAVAAIFIVDSVRREYKTGHVNFQHLTPDEVAKLINAVTVALTKEKPFAEAVLGRGMEYVKWSGMYYDEESAKRGIEPGKITELDATSVMQTLSRAFMAIADDKSIAIGRTAFPIYFRKVSKEPISS